MIDDVEIRPEDVENLDIVARIHEAVCSSCNTNPAGPIATCPFVSEIRGVEKLCNCCDRCRQNCADDI